MTRSPEHASSAATEFFKEVCEQACEQDVSPSTFRGPTRPYLEDDRNSRSFTFVWTGPNNAEIEVDVTYFPYDLSYIYTEGHKK